jgi:hypothetical protein
MDCVINAILSKVDDEKNLNILMQTKIYIKMNTEEEKER